MRKRWNGRRMCVAAAAVLTAAAMGITAVPKVNVEAAEKETNTEAIIFPITLYDFPMDNILFEYELGTGLDLLDASVGTSTALNGVTVGSGLVTGSLGAGGPVFTRAAYEFAAEKMAEELLNYPVENNVRFQSETFFTLKENLTKNLENYTKTLGDANEEVRRAYEDPHGWSVPNENDFATGASEQDKNTFGPLANERIDGYEEDAVLWEQSGDGVIGYDSNLPLIYDVSSIVLAADSDYELTFYGERNPASVKVEGTGIAAAEGSSLQIESQGAWNSIKFITSESALLSTITITPKEGTEDGSRIAAMTLKRIVPATETAISEPSAADASVSETTEEVPTAEDAVAEPSEETSVAEDAVAEPSEETSVAEDAVAEPSEETSVAEDAVAESSEETPVAEESLADTSEVTATAEVSPVAETAKTQADTSAAEAAEAPAEVPLLTNANQADGSVAYFYDQGWQTANSEVNATADAGKLNSYQTIFTPTWKQEGDGVRSLTDTGVLEKTFDFTNARELQLRFWYDEENTAGLQIVLYEDDSTDGTVIYTNQGETGWVTTDSFSLHAETEKVTIRIEASEAGQRIANLSAYGVPAIGSYEDTEAYYQTNNFSLDNVRNCMDYVYYVMNHFFTADDAVNRVGGAYNSIVLSYDPDSKLLAQLEGFGIDVSQLSNIHSFIADQDGAENGNVIRDIANGKMVYDPSGEYGTVYSGFFPLDESTGIAPAADADSPFISGDWTLGNVHADGEPDNYQYHNYHFSMASNSSFKYLAGSNQFFYFEGDDDVYMYIDGKMAINLGGAHLAADGFINLDEIASAFGLVDGTYHNFDFYYMERRTDFSNFAVATNINFVEREAEKLYESRHQFVAEDGSELPEKILELLPEGKNDLKNGTTVTVGDLTTTSVKVEGGTWKFISWDHAMKTIEDQDAVFVGTWKFIADEEEPEDPDEPETPAEKLFKAVHQFVSQDGSELPEEVLALLPKDKVDLKNNAAVAVGDLTETSVKVAGGTWKFTSWDAVTKAIKDQDVVFVGTWTYIADEPATPTDTTDPSDDRKDDSAKPSEPGKKDGSSSENNSSGRNNSGRTLRAESASSNGSGRNTASQVRTGDETPIVRYGALMGIALLGLVLVLRRRQNRS